MSSSNAPYIYDQTAQQKQTANTLVFGIPVPHTDKRFQIGDRIQDVTTGGVYEYGLANEIIPAYSPVSYSTTGLTGLTDRQIASATSCLKVKGISQIAVNIGEYFFYLIKGPGRVLTTSVGVVDGTVMIPDIAAATNAVSFAPGGAYAQSDAEKALLPRFIATGAEDAGSCPVIV